MKRTIPAILSCLIIGTACAAEPVKLGPKPPTKEPGVVVLQNRYQVVPLGPGDAIIVDGQTGGTMRTQVCPSSANIDASKIGNQEAIESLWTSMKYCWKPMYMLKGPEDAKHE